MMRRSVTALLGAIAAIALLLGQMTPAAAQDGTSEQLQVVATFSVLADVVANVGGDRVAVETLVGVDGDAHTFEPSPADVAKIADAAIIFENGLDFETWLDGIVDASGTSATRIVVTETIEPRAMAEGEEHHDEDEHADGASPEAGHDDEEEHEASPETVHDDDEHGHEHGEFDPHVWHDPINVIAEVEVIRAALAAADPANAVVYDANAAAYTAELQELDGWIRAEVAKIPEDRRRLVTSHDTFGYFAERYGFEVVGTALGSLSTETGDPPASEIAELIEHIEEAGVPAIFAENVHNPDLMESIAREAGVELAPELYTDALGPDEGGTYIGMMRHNVTVIVAALSV